MPFGSGKLLPPSPVHLAASVHVKCRAMMSCTLSIGTLMAPASAGSYMNTLKNNLSSGERKQRSDCSMICRPSDLFLRDLSVKNHYAPVMDVGDSQK